MDDEKEYLKERRNEEYQMQHFGFTSSMLKNEVKEMIMACVENAAKAMEKSFLDKYSDKSDDINAATKTLIEDYVTITNDWMSSVELKLDQFTYVPKNILLEDDRPQIKQFSAEEVKNMDEDMKELEKKIIKARIMKAKLKDALKSSEKTLKQHSKLPKMDCESFTPTSEILVKELEKIQKKLLKMNDETREVCLLKKSRLNN